MEEKRIWLKSSGSEHLTSETFKLNERYKLKVISVNVTASSCSSEDTDKQYKR